MLRINKYEKCRVCRLFMPVYLTLLPTVHSASFHDIINMARTTATYLINVLCQSIANKYK